MPLHKPLNKPLLAALALSTVAATTGAAIAAHGSDRATPAPLTRVTHVYGPGPGAEYDGDAGGISTVDPTRVRIPGGKGVYAAVVELSFQYRTVGPGPFSTELGVRDSAATAEDAMAVLPGRLLLAPVTRATSTTVRFVVRRLEAGHSYDVTPGVNSVFGDHNEISSSRVVLTVDLTRR